MARRKLKGCQRGWMKNNPVSALIRETTTQAIRARSTVATA